MQVACACVTLAVVAASASSATQKTELQPVVDGIDVPASPLDLTSVTFGERGTRMLFEVSTTRDWNSKQLLPQSNSSICVRIFKGRTDPARGQVCVARVRGATGLRYSRLDSAGGLQGGHAIKALVSRHDAHSLRATFSPTAVGLRPGKYSWEAETAWTDAAGCATPRVCVDRVPNDGRVVTRIARREVTGCVPRGSTQRRSGARGSRKVALTFDDGPSAYTPAILRILERAHVPATFFVVGNQVPGRAALLRRVLRDGSIIGNHTLAHANVAGAGGHAVHQIAAAQAIIRRASGFTPCLFRPPYGATSAALSGVVRSLGALSILWDVDPQDWRTPGTASIVSTVLHQTRTGSIILLHDGGGSRSQTVAALPTIIRKLRHRGLKFGTVPDLLHLRLRE